MFTRDQFQTDPVRKSNRINLLFARDRSDWNRSGPDPNGTKTGPAFLQVQIWIRLGPGIEPETHCWEASALMR